jgi:hypothetical protein
MDKLHVYECYIRTSTYGRELKVQGAAFTMAEFRDNVEKYKNKIVTKIRFIKTV